MSLLVKRDYFYYVKCLETGQALSQKADSVCESASTIKVPILAALFKEVEKKALSLRAPLKLKVEHYSHNGSGILQNFYRTRPLTIHDLALMMIILSDNVATNALIELLGKEKINDYIRKFGMAKTRLIMSRLTFPENYGIHDEKIGETTPREMASFLERSLSGQLLNSTNTKLMKKFLANTRVSFFGRKLPSSDNTRDGKEIISFGNQTGACYYKTENQQVINDCGFFKSKDQKNYIFSVYSSGATDRRMQYAMDSFPRTDFANVSKKIYEQLKHNKLTK